MNKLLLSFFSAFKHFKRAEFSNKNLANSTVSYLDKQGVNWIWLTGEYQIYINLTFSCFTVKVQSVIWQIKSIHNKTNYVKSFQKKSQINLSLTLNTKSCFCFLYGIKINNRDRCVMSFIDAKTSDQRATIPYLLQEMCTDYDEQEDSMKKKLDMATSPGFHGRKFILDRNHQLCLQEMRWLEPTELGESFELK